MLGWLTETAQRDRSPGQLKENTALSLQARVPHSRQSPMQGGRTALAKM